MTTPTPEPAWPDSVPTLIDPDRTLTLRAHQPGDLAGIVEACTDPEWVRWTTTPDPYTVADGRGFLDAFVPQQVDGGWAMMWAIEAEVAGVRRYCGSLDIRFVPGGAGQIAFGLHPAARGRGLLTRAGRLALDWAFDARGLESVEWVAKVGNWASRHAAAALGFRFEGVRRAHLLQRGVRVDAWTATLLRTEPRASLAPPRQPDLAGPGIRLRPFVAADIPRIAAACADPASQHWLSELPRPYGLEQAAGFVEACREAAATHENWTWCITAAPGSDDACLGAITLFGLSHREGAGEIGYWTHPAARGRGVMSAAARAVADFALGDGPHEVVTMRIAPGNLASRCVAAHAGASETGRVPSAATLGDGSRTDMLIFSRVRQPAASS